MIGGVYCQKSSRYAPLGSMAKSETTPIGRQIKALRLGRRLSQEHLGREIGVSMMTVSRWERGEIQMPDPQQLEALASLFETTVDELLDRPSDDDPSRGEPPYPAWAAFVESDVGRGMTDRERKHLADERFDDYVPTPLYYQQRLLQLRMLEEKTDGPHPISDRAKSRNMRSVKKR